MKVCTGATNLTHYHQPRGTVSESRNLTEISNLDIYFCTIQYLFIWMPHLKTPFTKRWTYYSSIYNTQLIYRQNQLVKSIYFASIRVCRLDIIEGWKLLILYSLPYPNIYAQSEQRFIDRWCNYAICQKFLNFLDTPIL